MMIFKHSHRVHNDCEGFNRYAAELSLFIFHSFDAGLANANSSFK